MIELYKTFTLLNANEIELVLDMHRNSEVHPGTVGDEKLKHLRNNQVSWHDSQEWLYFRLLNTMRQIPNVEIVDIERPFQIAEYNQGEFYEWHTDFGKGVEDRLFTLVCTLQTAPEARFETPNQEYDLQPGQAVIINSDVLHRATPPQSGTRISLTAWGLAPVILI